MVIFHSYVNLPEGNRKRLLNQPDLGPYDFPFPTSEIGFPGQGGLVSGPKKLELQEDQKSGANSRKSGRL